jgi:hypothetical protein
MSAQFWPCPGCSRHVKRSDATCPFCGAIASADIGPIRVLAGRLSRAAIFAAGTVGATLATDCSSTSVSQPMLQPMYGGSSGMLDDGGLRGQPAYGGSPITIETEDSSANDGPSVADTGDASVMPPTDSASASEAATSAEGSPDAGDASPVPSDSSNADDVPVWSIGQPVYGAPIIPDE